MWRCCSAYIARRMTCCSRGAGSVPSLRLSMLETMVRYPCICAFSNLSAASASASTCGVSGTAACLISFSSAGKILCAASSKASSRRVRMCRLRCALISGTRRPVNAAAISCGGASSSVLIHSRSASAARVLSAWPPDGSQLRRNWSGVSIFKMSDQVPVRAGGLTVLLHHLLDFWIVHHFVHVHALHVRHHHIAGFLARFAGAKPLGINRHF